MANMLKRYNLEFERAVVYARNQLKCSHVLSTELNSLDFKNGQFFTLLPRNVEMSRIYDFFCGLKISKNEIFEQFNETTGEKIYYSWEPLYKKISYFISEELKLKDHYVSIFEEVQQELSSPHIEFFHQFGFSCLNQMYYFLSKKDAFPELISRAMSESDALWHQLFILTKVDPKVIDQFKPGQELNLDEVKEFVKNIRLLVLGAYDGEGYFFWEPSKIAQFPCVDVSVFE